MRASASLPQPRASSSGAFWRKMPNSGNFLGPTLGIHVALVFPTKRKAWEKGWESNGGRRAHRKCEPVRSHMRYGDDMQDNFDNGRNEGRTTRAGVLLSLGIGACVTLLASGCSKSHVQETVTIAPRAATTQAYATKTTTVTNSNSAAPPA